MLLPGVGHPEAEGAKATPAVTTSPVRVEYGGSEGRGDKRAKKSGESGKKRWKTKVVPP